jgi:opacity protein-like surface antigen
MIYGAAGWALAGLDYRTELTSVVPGLGTFSSVGSTEDVADGLAIGGGFEYAINESMSIGAQYLRLYLESEGDGFGSQALGPFFATLTSSGFPSAATRDVDLDLVSARLNIRLNGQD